jgi:Zn-dependent protease
MLFPNAAELVGRLLILLVAATFHEAAHAWVAFKLGDYTAYARGRISLNPLDHIDPVGALMILLTGWGWFKPVPVDPYQLRRAATARQGMALTAAAGPASNILLAIVAALVWRLSAGLLAHSFVAAVIETFVWTNIGLALFNMIPVPPLDGSKVMMGIVPLEWSEALLTLEPYGMYIFLAVIMASRFGLDLVGPLIEQPASMLYWLLMGSG